MSGQTQNGIQSYRTMVRRQYMSIQQAAEALELLLVARKNAGFDTLPAERAMAKEIHCSMMTLRRALDLMAEHGRIIRENGIKRICDSARNLTKKHTVSVAFLAVGINYPGNIHYRKVAEQLEIRFRDTSVHFQFVGTLFTDTVRTLMRKPELSSLSGNRKSLFMPMRSPNFTRRFLLCAEKRC